jgi:long-chain fatty acid transport protein
MARNILKISTLALLTAASVVSAAHAGGFSRGTADTDIIFEDGNFNLRAGATIVTPTRKFTVGPGAFGATALKGTSYTDQYVIPSAAIKLNVTDDLRCAGTFSQPYGGSVSYASPTTSGKLNESFTINEVGLTCGYKVDLSTGRAWLLGGIYQETFDYTRLNYRTAGTRFGLNLAGTDVGFRVGAAYEIPEYALRAQVMYRAASSYGATGTFDVRTLGGTVVGGPFAATGTGTLPQSFELKVKSGVAPDWLVFGSVKWTDWSVTKQLIVNVPALAVTQTNDYFWKDGWTVSAGVGHKFTDEFSGALSLTWDSAVKTGYDLSSQTLTLGAGGVLKDKMGGELTFGGGVTYIAGATETKNALGTNMAVSSGMAYALGASYKTKW